MSNVFVLYHFTFLHHMLLDIYIYFFENILTYLLSCCLRIETTKPCTYFYGITFRSPCIFFDAFLSKCI